MEVLTLNKRVRTKWRDIVSRRMIELDITQAELAKTLKVGRSTIGHWLTGMREPRSLDDFESLAKALHLDPAQLMNTAVQKETRDILNKEELNLLSDYRKLSPKDKITIKRMVESLPKTRSK